MPDLRPMDDSEKALARKAKALLAALGKGADAVALKLAWNGIRGRRDTSNACPLALLLSHALGGSWRCGQGIFFEQSFPDTPEAGLPLPAACADFCLRFDAGEYPQLEEQA